MKRHLGVLGSLFAQSPTARELVSAAEQLHAPPCYVPRTFLGQATPDVDEFERAIRRYAADPRTSRHDSMTALRGLRRASYLQPGKMDTFYFRFPDVVRVRALVLDRRTAARCFVMSIVYDGNLELITRPASGVLFGMDNETSPASGIVGCTITVVLYHHWNDDREKQRVPWRCLVRRPGKRSKHRCLRRQPPSESLTPRLAVTYEGSRS